MADFVLGRLKFVYKGNWTTSTALTTDDIVKYGGNAFVVKQNKGAGPKGQTSNMQIKKVPFKGVK